MNKYSLNIYGNPVAKARPRVVHGHGYTPEKTKTAEEAIGWLFKAAYPGIQVDAEHEFRINVTFEITPYKNGKPRKFDLDNGLKTVLDALNGIVWADDNQVTEAEITKYIAGVGKTRITIFEFPRSQIVEIREKPLEYPELPHDEFTYWDDLPKVP